MSYCYRISGATNTIVRSFSIGRPIDLLHGIIANNNCASQRNVVQVTGFISLNIHDLIIIASKKRHLSLFQLNFTITDQDSCAWRSRCKKNVINWVRSNFFVFIPFGNNTDTVTNRLVTSRKKTLLVFYGKRYHSIQSDM